MKKAKYLLFLILLLVPLCGQAKVTCQKGDFSAEVSVSSSGLSINDTSTISISSDYTYSLSYVISDKSILSIENNIIKPISSGSTKVSLVFSFLNDQGKSDTCTTNMEITILNDDATLKSIIIDDEEVENFASDTYSYDIDVPYSSEEIIVSSVTNDEGAKVSGNGKFTLNVGENAIKLLVTAEDGSSHTYTLNVTRREPSSDATLKSLIVQGYNLTPKFSSDTYEYTLNVGEDVSNITIKCETSNEEAKISGDGKVSLATGENTINVVVSAEDGSTETYTIIVNKSSGTAYLTSLEVTGYSLDKKFTSDTYTYYLSVGSDVDELEINATSTDDDQIEIIGNDELISGTNEIIIRVSGSDKSSTSYKIVVAKQSLEEEIEENNTIRNKILLVIFVILVVIMFTSIIIFIYRIVKNRLIIKRKGVR